MGIDFEFQMFGCVLLFIFEECKLKLQTYEKYWDSITTMVNLRKFHLNISTFPSISFATY